MLAMASGGGKVEEPAELLVVKKGSKLHAKMVSKEAAAQLAVPSFRVYYPVASAGAVPFLWESQPGTPKHGCSSSPADLPPPLTPPPSYYHAAGGRRSGGKNRLRPGGGGGLLGAILPWRTRITVLRQRTTTPAAACSSWSSSSWSSSTSSSNSNTSSTMSPVFTVQREGADSVGGGGGGHHRRAFSAGDAAVAGGDYDDDAEEENATPRCFWTDRECCERRVVVVKGCGVAVAVRNALARVVGGKPSGGRRSATASFAAA